MKRIKVCFVLLFVLTIGMFQGGTFAENQVSSSPQITITPDIVTLSSEESVNEALFASDIDDEKSYAETEREEKRNVIDVLFESAALLVSIIAVRVSVCSYKKTTELTKRTIELQEEQNRKCVQPILAIHLDLNEISIKVKNHDVGPAVMKSMSWYDTELKESFETLEKVLDHRIERIIPVFIEYMYTKPFRNNPEDPDVIAPGEMQTFIQVKKNYRMGEQEIRICRQLDGVRMRIEYTDIYESNTWTLEKDLSWFANRVK